MSRIHKLDREFRHFPRFDKVAHQHIEKQIKEGKFKTEADYFDWLVKQHRGGRDLPMSNLAETIFSTLDKFRKDIRGDIASMRRSVELSNAFEHALVKMLLVNFPEADAETRKLAEVTASKRYKKLLEKTIEEYDNEINEEHELNRMAHQTSTR